MITQLQMYLLTMCERIYDISLFICILSAIIAAIMTIGMVLNRIDGDVAASNILKSYLKKIMFIVIPSMILSTFTPNTKEMAAIIIISKIVNNEKIQDCTKNFVDLANEWMVELKPNKSTNK